MADGIDDVRALLKKPSHVASIPVGLLSVDHRYQRPLVERRLREMKSKFDTLALGVIMVSERSNGWYILDGQHRWEMAKQLLGPDFEMDCRIYTGQSLEDEARLFYYFNAKRGPVDAGAQFKSRLQYNEPIAISIKTTVEKCGFEVRCTGSGHSPANALSCVGALEQLHKAAGNTGLELVLSILNRVWMGDRDVRHGLIILGLGDFLRRYQGFFDIKHLENRLRKMKPVVLIREADNLRGFVGGNPALRLSKAIWTAYNHNLRTSRLPNKYDSDATPKEA